MSNTDDHIQIISSDPTGATIATDYHAGTQRHWQVVKLNTGGDGASALLSNTNPLPISYSNAQSQTYVPISGNTAGTTAAWVYVKGGAVSADIGAVTFNVGAVTVSAGTLGNVQLSGGSLGNLPAGATIDVVNTITTVTTITNDVGVTAEALHVAGGTVGVQSVAIPVRIQHGQVTAGAASTALGGGPWTSGVRVTNNGPNDVWVGNFDGGSTVTVVNGYKLANLDSIFLEVSGATAVGVIRAGASCSIQYIGS
jgi:hypothetical protein